MVLSIRDTLMWYKRPDVRAAMIVGAVKKEIGIRFGEGFGKRPDSLEYEQEILEAVQRGATSFHASEELWSNPRSIETGMNKEKTNDLRVGWDLVLDIDFTNFEATKIITRALCEELEKNGVYNYGVKFSGNKGFHIGVAWEAFPKEFQGASVATQFPDAARNIANFLVRSVDNPENGFALSERMRKVLSLQEAEQFTKKVCGTCGNDRKDRRLQKHYVCSRCGHHEIKPSEFDDYVQCPKCKSFLEKIQHESDADKSCEFCGGLDVRETFDLKIDTQLVSSRHLYRLEYSLHEKSGLVSIPIDSSTILTFSRDQAKPEVVNEFPEYWKRSIEEEASALFSKAQAFSVPDPASTREQKEVVWDGDAAPEESFPPCIQLILQGLKDGKKRSTFVLINFLQSVGWNKDMIEKKLEEWNQKNPEPLREVVLKGSLRYHLGKRVLPPNCDNKAYYVDFAVCKPDALCAKIKNPVQYTKLKLKQLGIKSGDIVKNTKRS